MNITAIILTGGMATRMDKMCLDIPKSMLNFAGYPFLQYLISWLSRMGLREILISTFCHSEKIVSVFSLDFWKSRGVKIVKEAKPLGTGGAIKFACEHSSNEDVFICNGDTVVELDFFRLHELSLSLHSPITAILTLSKGVPNQGAVVVENGIITEFCEGGDAKDVIEGENYLRGSSTGCYFARRTSVLSLFPAGRSSLEREVLPVLVSKRTIGAICAGRGFFLDYGVPSRHNVLNNNPWILKKIYGVPFHGDDENEK